MSHIDKIKEAINEKRQQIARVKKEIEIEQGGVIDKFTSVDEILNQLLREQQESNNLLELQIRILYAIYKKEIGQGSQSIDIQQPLLDIEDVFSSRYQTRFIPLENPDLGTGRVVHHEEGSGYIVEIIFVSSTDDVDNKSYSVRIIIDDNTMYNGSFTSFETRSLRETDLTCYEDDNYDLYILHFSNIFYIYNFTVEVYANDAQFEQIYIKYNREV